MTFLKTEVDKKNPFCCNPPFDQKIMFFKLSVLKPKTLMLNKKHNLKSANSKDKKKELERKKTGNQKDKLLMKKKLAIEFFDVVPFMKEKQRRKKKKEREKNKEPKESKNKDKKEERKKRRKKNRERETQKEGGERKRNTENKQEMPFSRGKTRLFVLNNQKTIQTKQNKKTTKTNKEGLGPSEVAPKKPK